MYVPVRKKHIDQYFPILSGPTNAKIVHRDELYKAWEGGGDSYFWNNETALTELEPELSYDETQHCKMLTANNDIICKNYLNHSTLCSVV